ncbi:hypothetical protein I3679_014145 [Proteus mirabilis]|uniref:Uncharacterized protein n=1 Tax=Proteus mirabilis TaxID=584 RepID=A0ABD5LXU3_PROMI
MLSGDTDEADIEPVDGGSLFVTNNPEHVTPVEAPVSGHAVTALTCQDLWPVASHLDDIEHLQTQIYRTLFELGMSWIYLPPLWRLPGAFSGIYYVVSTFGAGACDDGFQNLMSPMMIFRMPSEPC